MGWGDGVPRLVIGVGTGLCMTGHEFGLIMGILWGDMEWFACVCIGSGVIADLTGELNVEVFFPSIYALLICGGGGARIGEDRRVRVFIVLKSKKK